ncbi:uncharacterized protein SOCEGT47_080890 [Sorangium cellulosum]|uniref:HTH lysR-type domain-containing protein n=1 Tax=Sorangium cellulosum TaxID=56 RepID=A0A4P2QDL8_SORCE|nr:LysR family transcriptional regulator [Sorangium cellulosum]AUX27498.1 uncharacterized protein SOCEGT47_080890 [Sorangium cellulosum]
MTAGHDAFHDLRFIVALAAAGSLAGAAKRLGVSPSALSRRLSGLEERLGVRLVQRTTRSLSLTPAGALYRERAERLLADLSAAEREVRGEEGALQGTLRISAPTVLGEQVVARAVASFLVAAPGVRVELELTERYVDVVKESFGAPRERAAGAGTRAPLPRPARPRRGRAARRGVGPPRGRGAR